MGRTPRGRAAVATGDALLCPGRLQRQPRVTQRGVFTTLPGTADSGQSTTGRPLPPRLAGSVAAQPCSDQGTCTQRKTREKGLLLKTAKNEAELKRALWVPWPALGETSGAGRPRPRGRRGQRLRPREALPPTPGDGPPSGSDTCFMVRGGRGGDVFPSCGRVTGSTVPAEAHDAKPNTDYKPKCRARVFQVKTEIETDDAGQRGAPAGVCGFSVAESPAFLSASL